MREGAHTHTHAFLIVFIRKLMRNPRRREGAHTDRHSLERWDAHTHIPNCFDKEIH